MATYFCRADGTAATYDVAIGPENDASKCMTFAVHNAAGDVFLPDDDIELSDQGGVFNEILVPPSSGDADNQIAYKNVSGETPIISGSDNEGVPSYDRSECIDIDGKNYITIDGIEYRYSGGVALPSDGEGIKLSNDVIGIIIQNCHGHHHKNEALKHYGASISSTNGNVFHDNLDSDVSLHDSAEWHSSGDEMYDSPYGVENIGTSKAYIDNLDAHGHGLYAVALVADSPYLELTNSTLDLESNPALPGGVLFGGASSGVVGSVGNGNTIKNCRRGVNIQSTGTVYVRRNNFENTTENGVKCGTAGISWITDNNFKKCLTYGIKKDSLSTVYAFRNRNTDLLGGAVYGNFAYLSGLFYFAGNISDRDASYGFYVIGTVNALSVIANNYINDSAFNGVHGNSKIFILRNNAVQGSANLNYRNIENCSVVESNISSKADLPGGNGNVSSATFTDYFESIVPAESDYALPIEDAGAHKTGISPGIASFLTYYNNIRTVFSDMDIGAKGILRSTSKGYYFPIYYR